MAAEPIVTRKPGTHRSRRHIIFPAMHRLFDIEMMHEYGINIKDFTIYLDGYPREYGSGEENYDEPGIEYQMANRFVKNLHILQGKNPKRPILIHMRTPGGDPEIGLSLYDSIRACPNNITIVCHTAASSMSSVVLQAADKRLLKPHAYFLFHEGTMGFEGTSKQVQAAVEWEKRFTMPRILDIYVASLKRKGKFKDWPAQKIRKMLQSEMNRKEDVYLTPEEAVEWGFADEVFGANDRFDWESLRKYQ